MNHETEMVLAGNPGAILGSAYSSSNRGPLIGSMRYAGGIPYDGKRELRSPTLSAPTSNVCQKCGAQLEPDAMFCGDCGTVVVTEDTDSVRCAVCGRTVKRKKFCSGCGAPLDEV